LQTLFFEKSFHTIYEISEEYPGNCNMICIYTPFLKIVESKMLLCTYQ